MPDQATRFPNGVSTTESGTFKNFPYPDPAKAYIYFNDFVDTTSFSTTDWTYTDTGVPSRALSQGAGGRLLVTNDVNDNDAVSAQLKGEAFRLVAGKQMWFEVRFQVSDATESDVLFGLVITDTTPLAHTDGIVFRKDDGDANIDFASVKDSAGSTSDAVTTISSATFVKLGIYFDGKHAHLYKDGVKLSTVSSITIADDEDLTVTYHIQNGAAASKTMTIDYILAAIER